MRRRNKSMPPDFRCPISMEVMMDPVTISTGITYERRHIQRWFFHYMKKTCPATMQPLINFDLTPNETLKRLILAWKNQTNSLSLNTSRREEMAPLLKNVESSPFKVNYLKKLRSIMDVDNDETKVDFIRSAGVQISVQIVVQILLPDDGIDFTNFAACEEALGLLHKLPLQEDGILFQLLLKPESMKAMAIILQRGSLDARLYVVTIFRQMSSISSMNWEPILTEDQFSGGIFKALIELISDDVSSKASYRALKVIISILSSSRLIHSKVVEAGLINVLVDLLSDSELSISDSKCEKMLHLIKLLCKCDEGRKALTEHGLGIAALSNRLMKGLYSETKNGVKIFWLIASSDPNNGVLEEMLMYGAVKKLLTLLHLDAYGSSSTKDKVIKILKLHYKFWEVYPCFPLEFKQSYRILY
ncbi:E3 ubiquitin-protein ligase PUB23-like [Rutidosis leptorrhynchoides]|uniref:E3 ubiquitin-protein ligase PUB23-like n=1 Tax=Rutidosis leptorrhynchoides TaxID=125765 RepID=UPI003A98DABD